MEARVILNTLARATDTSTGVIRHGRQVRPLIYIRQVAHWLVRNLTGASYPETGRALGALDHTTALYACRKVDRDIAKGGPRLDILLAFIGYASRLP